MFTVSSIKKSYNKKLILSDISFQVDKGEVIAIIGANGCGKSTLLNILSGALAFDSGQIELDDTILKKNSKLFSKHIGYVPQDNPLIEELSAKDNLRLWYCDSSLNMKDELENGILKLLGIDEFINKPVCKLSGGMKKRLSIGCALSNNPNILILDEPSAALDIVCKREINHYIKTFKKSGGTVIISTHDEIELDLCDKIYLLKDGTLTLINNNVRGDELIEFIGAK